MDFLLVVSSICQAQDLLSDVLKAKFKLKDATLIFWQKSQVLFAALANIDKEF